MNGLELLFSGVIAIFLALNWERTIKATDWSIALPILGVVVLATALINGAQQYWKPRTKRVKFALDVLDPRYRACETMHLLAGELIDRLTSMEQRPINCAQLAAYLRAPTSVLRLPAAATKATMASSIERIDQLIKQIVQDNCAANGTVHPADIARGIRQAVNASCTPHSAGSLPPSLSPP